MTNSGAIHYDVIVAWVVSASKTVSAFFISKVIFYDILYPAAFLNPFTSPYS